MSKTAFILTAGYHVFEDAFMPIVIAMRESKGDILILHRAYARQGKLTHIPCGGNLRRLRKLI